MLTSINSSSDILSPPFSVTPGHYSGHLIMLINGFEEDATLAAVEAWADTVPAVGGTAE